MSICEAGILWRFVAHRYNAKLNEALKGGWKVVPGTEREIHALFGLHICFKVRLEL